MTDTKEEYSIFDDNLNFDLQNIDYEIIAQKILYMIDNDCDCKGYQICKRLNECKNFNNLSEKYTCLKLLDGKKLPTNYKIEGDSNKYNDMSELVFNLILLSDHEHFDLYIKINYCILDIITRNEINKIFPNTEILKHKIKDLRKNNKYYSEIYVNYENKNILDIIENQLV